MERWEGNRRERRRTWRRTPCGLVRGTYKGCGLPVREKPQRGSRAGSASVTHEYSLGHWGRGMLNSMTKGTECAALNCAAGVEGLLTAERNSRHKKSSLPCSFRPKGRAHVFLGGGVPPSFSCAREMGQPIPGDGIHVSH